MESKNAQFAQPKIFLSHSGRDKVRATRLARRLREDLAERGHRKVVVFNTSEPEHRYKELQELLKAGEEWQSRAQKYEEELLRYLELNLVESQVFVALVTRGSLDAASRVIEFEIDVARRQAEAKEEGPFFLPCVADGVGLSELPKGAAVFQGIELDEEGGLERLLDALERGLSGGAGALD